MLAPRLIGRAVLRAVATRYDEETDYETTAPALAAWRSPKANVLHLARHGVRGAGHLDAGYALFSRGVRLEALASRGTSVG